MEKGFAGKRCLNKKMWFQWLNLYILLPMAEQKMATPFIHVKAIVPTNIGAMVNLEAHQDSSHRIIELEGASKAIESNPLLKAGIQSNPPGYLPGGCRFSLELLQC